MAAIVVYTLIGFFLTPYLVERQLTNYVAVQLGRQLSVKKLQMNPYAFTLEISGLALKDADGSPILSFDRFFGDFELKSLFRRAWTFSEINLKRPLLHIDIRPDGAVNLAELLEDVPQSKPEGEAKPPRLYFVNGDVGPKTIYESALVEQMGTF